MIPSWMNLKEGPKPKWGCLSVAAPAALAALVIWVVIA